jgi:hypothetical protein
MKNVFNRKIWVLLGLAFLVVMTSLACGLSIQDQKVFLSRLLSKIQ